MLMKIAVKNFKKLSKAEIELGNPVVFIGPNNSGKSTALQAFALWQTGISRWMEKKGAKTATKHRSGVSVNRKDLVAIPVPNASFLWKEMHTRDMQKANGKLATKNVKIEIIIEGVTNDKAWICGLEFDYANPESFYCRPVKDNKGIQTEIPVEAQKVKVAFLPPMSGLSADEPKLEHGRINVLIGEGRTAEVLRNLCYQLATTNPGSWGKVTEYIRDLFGAELNSPEFISARGEIRMSYKEFDTLLDISCSGRGLQQTLLLLAYLYLNSNSVLLLDEPDAHLEILRQRQVYGVLSDVARSQSSQIIAASHSEIILNEAAGRDVVIAFLGKPHRINDRGSQLLKSLREIGFEQYYQSSQTGWVLYLEGSSDLAILKAFSVKLKHPANECLKRPFVCYVGNNVPSKAREHFYGLQEANKSLVGICIFDRIDVELKEGQPLLEVQWKKREFENYLCFRETLIAYAKGEQGEDLFSAADASRRVQAMESSIKEVTDALAVLGKENPWADDVKVSDEFMDKVFERYFKKLKISNIMLKKNYYELVRFVPDSMIDMEIAEKLDLIVQVAKKAKPVSD